MFLGKRKNLRKLKINLHEIEHVLSVISSLPGKSSSKSASFVIARALPVSLSFNLSDPLEDHLGPLEVEKP